jgi:hypothetical protein
MAHTYTDLPGAGTTLQIKISSTFTTIPGCTDLSWDGFKRGERNATYLTSAAVVRKPGMPDYGSFKCKCFYDPNDTTHIAIVAKLLQSAATQSAALDDFKLIYADGFSTPANVTFSGFVSDFSQATGDPETGTLTADLTVTISSVAAFTAGAPAA